MGSPRLSFKRSLLLSAAVAVSLLSAGAFAQNQNTNTPTSSPTSNRNTQSSSSSSQRTSASPPSTNTRSSSSSSLSLPPLTTPSGAAGGPTGLPTLSKTVNTEIPNYPPPTVPPTQNAPFMNHSTLPDGTVFICVGAILGAFGAAILAWRGIVACLLHRSVERATLAQHAANDKLPGAPSQFYKFLERDPSPVGGSSPGGGGGAGAIAGRIHRKSHRGPTPSATPSQTNLFFSPTAGPGGGTGMASSSNRDSRFLPSGFYASAAPMPGHATGNSISLSTLRPSSRGGRMDPSPPHSPMVAPGRNFSASSLSLNRPPSANERAPSAFLDDLLGDQQIGPGGGAPYHPGSGPHGQQQMMSQPGYGGRGGVPYGPDGQYYSQSPSPPGHRGY
ncbi:vacuolar membrane protein [Echria macrotheca]|uniref:Vacuolar membrane protein n=1 Tax=Echria macrotheca TaxID=438768 RepID=A0AAJ0BM67_9PEZI|nr:vacuolar membrane protein [Echria macrotheca]